MAAGGCGVQITFLSADQKGRAIWKFLQITPNSSDRRTYLIRSSRAGSERYDLWTSSLNRHLSGPRSHDETSYERKHACGHFVVMRMKMWKTWMLSVFFLLQPCFSMCRLGICDAQPAGLSKHYIDHYRVLMDDRRTWCVRIGLIRNAQFPNWATFVGAHGIYFRLKRSLAVK